MRDSSCYFYPKIAGACRDIIRSRYVYGDSGFLRGSESLNARFEGYLRAGFISEECKFSIKEVVCRYLFPLCDTSLNKPLAQGICRETCQFLIYGMCTKELYVLRAIAKTETGFEENLINCTTYTAANGGEAPECYQHRALPGDYLTSCGFRPPVVQKVDNAIVQLFSLILMDHYTFLRNCPPTPPLS